MVSNSSIRNRFEKTNQKASKLVINKKVTAGLISNKTSAARKIRILVMASSGFLKIRMSAFLKIFNALFENRLMSNEINGVINNRIIKSPKNKQLTMLLL